MITGLICKQMEAILDDPASPRWVDDCEIHDDPPVHDKVRQGKHRRRVDLKLTSRRFRPRCRFCFEAKCLNRIAGVAESAANRGQEAPHRQVRKLDALFDCERVNAFRSNKSPSVQAPQCWTTHHRDIAYNVCVQLTAVKISFERVDNFDACKREVLGVPRCDGQLELASRCGDETVFHRHGTPLFS